jgi:hypothetical protein
MEETTYRTRLEHILGVPLAEDVVRQWPQSGELIRGRTRIAEVESHFEQFYIFPKAQSDLDIKVRTKELGAGASNNLTGR